MKKIMLIGLLGLYAVNLFGQGRSISLVEKTTSPIVTSSNDTIKVGDEIILLEGSNEDGNFKYIQVLNSFNEPIQPATSRMAFKKQKVKFFKEQYGITYLFTELFAIEIEIALRKEEIKLVKPITFVYSQDVVSNQRLAGEELITFQKHFFQGLVLTSIVAPLFIAFYFILLEGIFLYVAGVSGFIGSLMILESYTHIGKAGKYLKKIPEFEPE